MKRLIFILALIFVAATNYAQYINTVTATEGDTLRDTETDYVYVPNSGGYITETDLTIQMLCTQIGGTSDGTVTLEGSIDGTSYAALPNETFTDLPVDTATISDGAVLVWEIPRTYFYKYRLKIAGTSGDTTLLSTKYRIKKIE
jgi:hypothetical protein